MVVSSEAAAAPAVALELWWGKVVNKLATKGEVATEAAAVMAVTEAVAEAAAAGCTTAAAVSWRWWWWWQMRRQRRRRQQQWWRGQRIKGSGNSKGSGGNVRSGDRVLRVCYFHKFISYVASYINPIQTGLLMTFQNIYGGTGIVFPVKKNTMGAKKGIRRIPT